MEGTSLSEVLDDSVQDDDEPSVEVKAEKSSEKGEETVTPADDDITTLRAEAEALRKERDGLQSGIQDERRKRQTLEREQQFWDELKSRKADQEPVEEPDPVVGQMRSEMQQALLNERFNMSERFARSQHGDDVVSAAADAFQGAADNDPALRIALQQQSDPYGYVVNWHKQQNTLKEVGSIDELRAKIEAETRAKIEAEFKAKVENMPPNLANEPSGSGGGTAWSGPTSLDDIL